MELSKYITNNKSFVNVLIILLILILAYLLGRGVRKLIIRVSNRKILDSKPYTRAFLVSIAKSITFFFITLAFIVGKRFFVIPEEIEMIIEDASRLLTTLSLGIWIYYLVEIPGIWFDSITSKNGSAGAQMLSPILKRTLHVVIIGLVLAQVFVILSNKPITPIIASLGIVGAAVALAAQDTFKNFFGSFVLAGDKPFEIGERVVIDGHDGPVESIGLRSTRIRTLEGHLVTIPNGQLANMTIQNIGKREYIRRIGTVSITYDTSPEKIEEAIAILNNIFDNHEGLNPDFPPKVYFNELSTYSLDILFIYWYHPPDYWAFMAFSQWVNLEIIKRFNKAGIEFAFPTQTIHMAEDEIK
jgi:MscS family membrane protein